MKYKRVNIGAIIQEVIADKKITPAKFAQMIGIQRQNINKTVLLKNSIDTNLLSEIGEILDFDFFEYYKPIENSNKKDYIKPKSGKLILEFSKNKADQIFKFKLGENNIEIFNK